MVPLKPGARAAKTGTQAPSPASVRLDADERDEHSSSGIPDRVTPEEPALRAGAPAFPGIPGVPRGTVYRLFNPSSAKNVVGLTQ